ncbi:KTSC domain-containing protein [Chitinivorax sp. PXF-14]
MDRKPLNSSRIRSVGYDAGQQVLEIEFRDGKVEQYSRVPSVPSR